MPMAEGALLYCNRCVREVEVVRPWAGYVWLKRAWFAGLALLLLLGPIIMSEITLLLPLAMVFAAAGGPLLALAGQKQTCRECGAQIGARVSGPHVTNPHAKPDSSQTR